MLCVKSWGGGIGKKNINRLGPPHRAGWREGKNSVSGRPSVFPKKRKKRTNAALSFFLKELSQELKRACGTGGTATEDGVELQGDLRERVRAYLLGKGFLVKG
jgi:hypothetical protein